MYQLENVTDDPNQQQSVQLPSGGSVVINLRYSQQQYCWFINSLTYSYNNTTFEIDNLMISNSPNLLRQFKNQIPFGLACYSSNNREPSQLEDFAQQASILYILSAAEVQEYETFLSGSAG